MRITMGIILILLAVGCRTTTQNQMDERIAAMQSIRTLALGCYMFAGDNDDQLPTDMAQLKPYVTDPYDPDAYTLTLTGKLGEVTDKGTTVLIRQNKRLPDNEEVVAYADGHAQIIATPQSTTP